VTDPITYSSRTNALGLPLLFAGQAQKEFFLNHALNLLDALMTRVVVASLASPPAVAAEGQCYRILDDATDAWATHDRSLAIRTGGGWHFVPPVPGMQVFDVDRGACIHFDGDWLAATEPTVPSGGTVVDLEARAAIAQIVEALKALGVFTQRSA